MFGQVGFFNKSTFNLSTKSTLVGGLLGGDLLCSANGIRSRNEAAWRLLLTGDHNQRLGELGRIAGLLLIRIANALGPRRSPLDRNNYHRRIIEMLSASRPRGRCLH